MIYLYTKQILFLYREIARQCGGDFGMRDERMLESAVYRPQATFGGEDLYPDLFSKTVALGHSIIQNHPFVDGNKRVGFEAMRLMLRLNGYDVRTSMDVKFEFVMKIAKGELAEKAIAEWLKKHSKPYSSK